MKVTLILLFVFPFTVFSQHEFPRFSQYLVDTSSSNLKPKVNLRSDPEALRYRTRLHRGANKGPDFADIYKVIIWAWLRMPAFCNRKLEEWKSLYISRMTGFGVLYYRNSKLFITDPIDKNVMDFYSNDIPDWLKTRDDIWDGERLKQIDSSQTLINEQLLKRQ